MVKTECFSRWMIVSFWGVLTCLLVQQIEVLEVKLHLQQNRLHDSLIAKLSHIVSTLVPLQHLCNSFWGISRDFCMVWHSYISIYLIIQNQKKKEINISAMKIRGQHNCWLLAKADWKLVLASQKEIC